VQGPYFQPAYDSLARGGRHVVFGAASMTPAGDKSENPKPQTLKAKAYSSVYDPGGR
jgi:NADPH:quinone reductase-like Zn-dependent oxidoreductase